MLTGFFASPRSEEVQAAVAALENPQDVSQRLASRKVEIALELAKIEAMLDEISYRSVCGSRPEWQEVEAYRDGSLGVSRRFVDDHQRPIGQVQWRENFDNILRLPPSHDGNVAGVRWATGGIIDVGGSDLFLTAGHVFTQTGLTYVFPSRGGKPLPPREIARLMRVNFNFQFVGTSRTRRDVQVFPIVELVEIGPLPDVDYAIVRLGRNAQNRTAGEIFGTLRVAAQDVRTRGSMLCIIQHPHGQEKKVEAGPMNSNNGRRITYGSLDTEDASSGAPILGPTGDIVGVHVKGGCGNGGVNRGQSIGVIREESRLLKAAVVRSTSNT